MSSGTISPDTIRELEAWADEECARWAPVNRSFFDDFSRQANKKLSVYVFDIAAGEVTFRQKPIEDPSLHRRAQVYDTFLRSLAAKLAIRAPITLILDVEDECRDVHEAPVMSFQRRIGSPNLLLPDIDCLGTSFYTGSFWALPDRTPFKDKLNHAIFVGSTTGTPSISERHVREGLLPRLRAARFFRDNPHVTFLLPGIVQCENQAVEALLREEGFGTSQVSWDAQLRNKFLISMDGNGATLSRVHVALASNSALIKYASPHEAFYFQRLVDGEHYISVEKDADILDVMVGDPMRFAPVAQAGRRFAETYLTRATVEVYAARLLTNYASIVQRNVTQFKGVGVSSIERSIASTNDISKGVPNMKASDAIVAIAGGLIEPPSGQVYTQFIADICRRRFAKRYLEIGVQSGANLAAINVDAAIAIDPSFSISTNLAAGKKSLELYQMTSDEYFATVPTKNIDLAFLDGMHNFEYLLRDFMNAEKTCNKTGLIMLHDCLPFFVDMIVRDDNGGAWTGDVWKVVQILEKYRPDLTIHIADCAPTGLVCIANLDPASRSLQERYDEIVEEFLAAPNDEDALVAFYDGRKIYRSDNVMALLGHSLL